MLHSLKNNLLRFICIFLRMMRMTSYSKTILQWQILLIRQVLPSRKRGLAKYIYDRRAFRREEFIDERGDIRDLGICSLGSVLIHFDCHVGMAVCL